MVDGANRLVIGGEIFGLCGAGCFAPTLALGFGIVSVSFGRMVGVCG